MYSSPISIAIWTAILVVTVVAVWKGGPAERIGALLNLFTCTSALVANQFFGRAESETPLLVLDALLAIGFLVLAVWQASYWLGGAMILQAVQFSLHAFYLVDERPHDLWFARINNIDTAGILLMILIGSILSWRKRVRLRREEAVKAAAEAERIAAAEAAAAAAGAVPSA